MIGRNRRRERIEVAFGEFRKAIAATLGNMSRQNRALVNERAQDMFELIVRGQGVSASLSDPLLKQALTNPLFSQRLAIAMRDRVEHFREWSERGVDALARLVHDNTAPTANQPYQNWLGLPGKADGSDGVPQLWRIGWGIVPAAPERQVFPAAVPLLDYAHLSITSTPDSRQLAEGLVENLLLRVLSHFQAGLVHIHIWDTNKLSGSLPGLYPLSRADLLTIHDPARFEDMLAELSEHARRVHTGVLVEGHNSVRSVSLGGRRTEPWHVVVVFGDHSKLRDDQQQKLQRIARTGLAAGIQLIVVDIPISLPQPLETINIDKNGVATSSMTGEHVIINLDPPFPREVIAKACAIIAEQREERRNRFGSFRDLLPDQLWQEKSLAGVAGPIGYYEGEPVDLFLGDTSPHALIGGPSGSGKTNFLYSMIAGLTSRYSPEELELYLLDFKEGVSFAQFAPGRKDPTWLPHARLVGVNINTDREFGLALLNFLADEMRRRADAAKWHEVTKLQELREEDPAGRWPRIVAIIDEFQYLFGERDQVTSQAARLLEDVARRGRSQGIHLVLCSQDVSGIEAFWGRSAIFEQFTLRIALPKARRILAEPQNDAINLPRWHAIVNHESGVLQGNQIARIPNATEKGTFDSLQAGMFENRSTDLAEPILFDGSKVPVLEASADFAALRPAQGLTAPTVLLGQIIDIAGSAARVDLARTPGRNIAVIGSLVSDAASILRATTLSLAKQHEPNTAQFTIVSLAADAWPYTERLIKELDALGHSVELLGLDGIVEFVNTKAQKLAEIVTNKTTEQPLPHYIVIYAVDGAQTMLDQKDPTTRVSGTDSLRAILKQGPETRTHILGWWRGPQRLKSTLPIGSYDDIGAWVAFDVQGKDLLSFGPEQVMGWAPRPTRGLFFDRFAAAKPQVIIPFDVGDES